MIMIRSVLRTFSKILSINTTIFIHPPPWSLFTTPPPEVEAVYATAQALCYSYYSYLGKSTQLAERFRWGYQPPPPTLNMLLIMIIIYLGYII